MLLYPLEKVKMVYIQVMLDLYHKKVNLDIQGKFDIHLFQKVDMLLWPKNIVKYVKKKEF